MAEPSDEFLDEFDDELPDEPTIETDLTPEEYFAQREPRFGEANPERMVVPFWQFMVNSGWTAWSARMRFDSACQEYMAAMTEVMPPFDELQKMSKEEQAALSARIPRYKYNGPTWCFSRFGRSETALADGSRVFIAGEHEDWYDPDFHIYNDVVVIRADKGSDQEIEIYGYPREVFRPTDFHSATLVGDAIYIVGGLGYWGTQTPGTTPVLRLDLKTFTIVTVPTRGDLPGWIHDHNATYVREHNAIRVRSGKVLLRFEGKRTRRQNRKTYWLDLATNIWSSGRVPMGR
ncbi:MAG: hypothetical protein U0X20_10760 [Caldilineaceae bacterium]